MTGASPTREPFDTVGIDAGATLWKLASVGEDVPMQLVPAGAFDEVKRWIDARRPRQLHVTGGGGSQIAAAIGGIAVRGIREFEAWAHGARQLALRAGWTLPERHLVVSLGTGTSILAVDGSTTHRVAGSTLGGGTLLGLGRLLFRAQSFADVVDLAARGERGRVDLLVRDIYAEGDCGLAPEATASSFAKLGSREPADLAHALMALVGENVGAICASVAQAMDVEAVVFGGGAVMGNPTLAQVLRQTLAAEGREAWFLPEPVFCGALGAALSERTPA